MAFHVYENWQAGPRKAVIHKGSCGFCKDGQGRAGGYDPTHAQWHGPFDDFNDSSEAIERLTAGCRPLRARLRPLAPSAD
jgi:hypothetical protein